MSKFKFGTLLMLALAMLATGGPVLADAHEPEFKIDGMLRTRFDHFEDYAATTLNTDDNFNIWAYRAKLGVTASLSKNIMAHIDVQAFGDYGDQIGGTSYGGGTGIITTGSPFSDSGSASSGNAEVYQAYIGIGEIGGSNWSIGAGRKEMKFGRELHFGDQDFYNGQTFDGAWAMGDYESWDIGFMFLNLNESFQSGTGDDDMWLFGGKADFTIEGAGKITPYIIHQRDGQNLGARMDLSTFGALWWNKGADTPWDASVEYALQSGEQGTGATSTDFGGWIFEGEFGWTFNDNHRVHVNVLNASGDDNPADTDQDQFMPLYPDLHSNNRLGNTDHPALGLSNIQDISLGYGFTGGEGTHGFMVALHKFTINEVAAGAEDDFGTEIDLQYNFKYSDNAAFQVGVAQLSAGDALQVSPGVDGEDPFRIYAGLTVGWGHKAKGH